jgi:hypothetical protein
VLGLKFLEKKFAFAELELELAAARARAASLQFLFKQYYNIEVLL